MELAGSRVSFFAWQQCYEIYGLSIQNRKLFVYLTNAHSSQEPEANVGCTNVNLAQKR